MKSFWRGIGIFILGGVLGTGFGVALGFFIFPYVFPPPAAAEQLADAERSNLVASGSFSTPTRPTLCIMARGGSACTSTRCTSNPISRSDLDRHFTCTSCRRHRSVHRQT